MLFEALRFNYIGPVNGHNIEEVERHLRMAASIDDQPVLLHVLTRKGKGYPPAEAQPSKFHGLGKFDVATGQTQPKPAGAPPTYTDIFGETLCRLAKEDDRIVAVTAAMSSGTGTGTFQITFSHPLHGRGHLRTARRHLRGGPRLARLPSLCGDLLHLLPACL